MQSLIKPLKASEQDHLRPYKASYGLMSFKAFKVHVKALNDCNQTPEGLNKALQALKVLEVLVTALKGLTEAL